MQRHPATHSPLVIALLLTACSITGSSAAGTDRIPAFPGAQGNGATTPGGRNGNVYHVTNLDDDGPGSLREACEAAGPRIVVINIGGAIELGSPIEISHPFITVAGQTASGDGLCLKNYGLNITANDVVIRYLRIRPGDEAGVQTTGIGIANSERVIIDHCSVSWTTGPALSVSGASNDVALQWCMFTESLFDVEVDSAKPGGGILLSGDTATFSFHHNYVAHHSTGSPSIIGASDGPGPLLDFRNNVVYDWGEAAGDSNLGDIRLNLVGNIYKAGPSTALGVRAQVFRLRSFGSKIHFDGNELVGSEMGTATNFLLLRMPDRFSNRHHFDMLKLDGPFDAAPVPTTPTSTALRRILAQSGATKPQRDEVDERVIGQYRLGGGRLVNTPLETGGYPDYQPGEVRADADADGMPDEWERTFGLSPSDPNDSAADSDHDGYTNIEEFLNSTEPATAVDR